MRRALLPILAAVALAATAVAAPAAKAPARKARAKAVAFVVQVVRPGVDPITIGSLRTRTGAATGGGDHAYPDDGAAVRVTGSTTAVQASASGTGASAHTTVTSGGVSLLGGLVTAASLRVAADADASGGRAKSAIRARVSGLRVAGVAIAASSNDVIDLPGVGTLTVGETVEAIRSPGGRRTFTVALHLRLAKAAAGLPAGSEILVGYAEGGAAAPKPPPVKKATSTTTPAVATTPPLPAETGNGGGRDTSRTQQPPAGGFTRTPPIRPETRAELLSGQYVFPVVGGAQFSDDFGGFRAETGFHQGIDLFSANGTPLVAVHDGTLFRVGWNRIGGWRVWLDDGQGNYFYYAHLSAYSDLAVDGARVHAGDVIGYMGDSGDAKGTPFHVHFEMHPDGGWAIPPIAYVSAWEQATPGVGSAATTSPLTPPGAVAPAPPATPPAAPEGAELEAATDISQASGLDDAALVQSAGGGAEGSGPLPEPDAIVAVGAENQPGFVGLTG